MAAVPWYGINSQKREVMRAIRSDLKMVYELEPGAGVGRWLFAVEAARYRNLNAAPDGKLAVGPPDHGREKQLPATGIGERRAEQRPMGPSRHVECHCNAKTDNAGEQKLFYYDRSSF